MANYDILGNIAIVKFQDDATLDAKKKFALKFLEENKHVKTVLEKTEKVHGRLRTIKTNFLAGVETLEADYKESGCRFKLNVETCYFSPRLANERLEIAKKIAKLKKPRVLVMFSGVAPFPIVIAKNAKTKGIVSIELGVECEKYATDNIWLNKVSDIVEHVQGDVNKILGKKIKDKYEVIVMPRPNLKDNFLKAALLVAKKGTLIFYYGFCAEAKKDEMVEELVKTAKKLKRKLKVLKVLEAGDIAPYEHRYRVEMKVLN
ncbi:MAG: hypothetical protein AABX17_01345 [Nanoarchaeota archaeon]